jgi:hypothetical protein
MVRARALFGGDWHIVFHELLNGNQPPARPVADGLARSGTLGRSAKGFGVLA